MTQILQSCISALFTRKRGTTTDYLHEGFCTRKMSPQGVLLRHMKHIGVLEVFFFRRTLYIIEREFKHVVMHTEFIFSRDISLFLQSTQRVQLTHN